MTAPIATADASTAVQRLGALGYPDPTDEAWAEAARLVLRHELYECVSKLDLGSTCFRCNCAAASQGQFQELMRATAVTARATAVALRLVPIA